MKDTEQVMNRALDALMQGLSVASHTTKAAWPKLVAYERYTSIGNLVGCLLAITITLVVLRSVLKWFNAMSKEDRRSNEPGPHFVVALAVIGAIITIGIGMGHSFWLGPIIAPEGAIMMKIIEGIRH